MVKVLNYSAMRVLEGKENVKRKLAGLIAKKQPGGKEVIVEVLLIFIAIVVALIWKTALGTTITTLVSSFTTKISGIFAAS